MRVTMLRPREAVFLDKGCLADICARQGAYQGQKIISEAADDLAELIYQAENDWRAGDLEHLRLCANQINALSQPIGMDGLADVSLGVSRLCGGKDPNALAALVTRMRRVGEGSLLAIWEAQDQSM